MLFAVTNKYIRSDKKVHCILSIDLLVALENHMDAAMHKINLIALTCPTWGIFFYYICCDVRAFAAMCPTFSRPFAHRIGDDPISILLLLQKQPLENRISERLFEISTVH